MSRLPLLLLSGLAVLLCGVPRVVAAQEQAPPAHVAFVDGSAVVERDAVIEEAVLNLPLEPGDRIRTGRGRAEVLFGDGSLLHLDDETTVDVLSDSLVRLLAGRLAIVAGSARGGGQLQIDTPAGSVRVTRPGEFRISVYAEDGVADVELATIRGSADLVTDAGSVVVGPGTRAVAREGEGPAAAVPFNSARWDAFDRWSQDRLAARRGATSHQYVPPPLRPYGGVLDVYGSWGYLPAVGHVWYPRVAAGWRPYHHGRWRFSARFGWTWIGADFWAWPTHHFGRWGLTPAGGWYWIPGRAWAPAWVHWAVAPGYVSWCAIGFDNRPVLPFWGGRQASRHFYRHDPWSAWTVVPRRHFGSHRVVTGFALDGRRLTRPGAAPAFVLQDSPPARPVAIPRGAVASRRAAPDETSPRGLGVAVPRVSATARSGEPRAAAGPRSRVGIAAPGAPDRTRGIASVAPRASRAGGEGTVAPRSRRETGTATSGTAPYGSGPIAIPRSTRGLPPSATAQESAEAGTVRGRFQRHDPGVARGAPAAVPRAGRSGWSPDSVPVHRGRPPAPSRVAPSPGPGSVAPAPRQSPGISPHYPGPGRAPSVAVPRSGAGDRTPGPGRMTAPGGRVAGPGRMSAPAAAPSPPPPSAGAGARQAPAGAGRGVAVPRGAGASQSAPPPSRRR